VAVTVFIKYVGF